MTATLFLLMPNHRNNHVGPASSDNPASRALEAAWERDRARLYNMAYQRLRCHDDAQDAMQETRIKAWRSMASFDVDRSFLPWASRILHNVCTDKLRSRKHRKEVVFSAYGTHEGSEGLEYDFPDEKPGPLEDLIAGELSEEIKAALLLLPPQFREAIMLADVAGCSYAEIAVEAGVPIGTVRSRIFRGRAILRRRLKG